MAILRNIAGTLLSSFSVGLAAAIKATFTASATGVELDKSLRVDGFGGKVSSVAIDTTLSDEYLLLVDATGGNRIITLPVLSTYAERTYRVVKTDSSTNTVTLVGNGGQLINTETSIVLRYPGDNIEVTDATTVWRIANRLNSININPPSPCRLATTEDVAVLAGGAPATVDGVNVVVGDRILVWVQNSAASDAENGVYIVSIVGGGATGTWVRAADYDSGPVDQIQAGRTYYVQEGTSWSRTYFSLATTGAITVGVTATQWIPTPYIAPSDTAGTDIIGTSGVPVAISNTYAGAGIQAGSTDCLTYNNVVWYVYVTAKSTATRIDMRVQWSEDNVYFDEQATESIASGTVTVDDGEWQYDISTDVVTFMKHLPLPTYGRRYAKFSVKSDAGTPSVYVRVVRSA